MPDGGPSPVQRTQGRQLRADQHSWSALHDIVAGHRQPGDGGIAVAARRSRKLQQGHGRCRNTLPAPREVGSLVAGSSVMRLETGGIQRSAMIPVTTEYTAL
jgi:hypothetical protein